MHNGARSKGSESHGCVEQWVTIALGVQLGAERWDMVAPAEQSMGPEFENPANNWYRSSGDSVTRAALGNREQ